MKLLKIQDELRFVNIAHLIGIKIEHSEEAWRLNIVASENNVVEETYDSEEAALKRIVEIEDPPPIILHALTLKDERIKELEDKLAQVKDTLDMFAADGGALFDQLKKLEGL